MDTLIAVTGILLSFVFFLVGYRQTVGAKKERIAACNLEIEKVLVRRVVLEAYVVARLDIDRLIEGKARDFRVHRDDIYSTAQTLNAVYTRIVESDLIPADQRTLILDRVVPALADSEAKPVDEIGSSLASGGTLISATSTAIGLMAILASLAGALVAALPELANLDTTYPTLFKTFFATAAASLVLIAAYGAIYRIRTSQEALPTRGNELENFLKFENAVAESFRKLGATVTPVPPGEQGDFTVRHGRRTYLVDVKAWPTQVPERVLVEVAARLQKTASEVKADEVLIVTARQLANAGDWQKIAGVQLLTVKQIGAHLSRHESEIHT